MSELRGALAGIAIQALAMLLLTGLAFVLLGDDFSGQGQKATAALMFAIVAFLAGAVGAAAGVWQAAAAGASSRAAAVAGGAAGPIAASLVIVLAFVGGRAGLGAVQLVASIAGALCGGAALGRHLQE